MLLKDFCTNLSLIENPNVFIEGQMLLFDKPLGWTSFDVVKKVRSKLLHTLKIKKLKVGHAGTLDPLATGLLILCTGKATKKIDELMGFEKIYEARIKFGATTPSFDVETEIDQQYPAGHINTERIEEALHGFEGEQSQVPPNYSAINIKGRRAYQMARNGEEFELKSRNIVFHELLLLGYENQEAMVRIRCSKGTYIRSFARDLGIALGSGAYLTSLRRTGIGSLRVDDAYTISNFEQEFENIKQNWARNGLI